MILKGKPQIQNAEINQTSISILNLFLMRQNTS